MSAAVSCKRHVTVTLHVSGVDTSVADVLIRLLIAWVRRENDGHVHVDRIRAKDGVESMAKRAVDYIAKQAEDDVDAQGCGCTTCIQHTGQKPTAETVSPALNLGKRCGL